MTPWYRESISIRKFKAGLKEAPLGQLKNLKVTFALEQRQGQKVSTRFAAVSKEIERRKKSAENNSTRGQRRTG